MMTTYIYFLHTHSIQQVSEKFVRILLLKAQVLIILPTDRHKDLSSVM